MSAVVFAAKTALESFLEPRVLGVRVCMVNLRGVGGGPPILGRVTAHDPPASAALVAALEGTPKCVVIRLWGAAGRR
jgi:hypothetical protein